MTKKNGRCVPRNPAMPQTNQKPIFNHAEAEIDRAVKKVYQMYGPDLSVFFRAVQGDLQLERHEKERSNEAPLHMD